MKDPYDEIGVPRDATEDEIKKAFRKKAMTCHPDRNPGKEAEDRFKDLTDAYMILGKRDKREHFDHTGEKKEQTNDQASAVEVLVMALKVVMQDAMKSAHDFDILEEMNTRLRNGMDVAKGTIKQNQRELKRLGILEKKLTLKDPDENDFLRQTLIDMFRDLEHSIADAKEELRVAKIALHRLKVYEFDFIPQEYGYSVNDMRRAAQALGSGSIEA